MPRARVRLRFARSASPPDEPTIGADRFTGGDMYGEMYDEIRRVAEKHAPEGGYGETAFNGDDETVWWTSADWSEGGEIDAAHADFMDIEGVNGVVGDSESRWPDDAGWEQVWPEPGSEAAYERVLALATRPLDTRKFVPVVPARVHYRPATTPGQSCGTCSAFEDGHCTMFSGQPPVAEDYVCDDWDQRADTEA